MGAVIRIEYKCIKKPTEGKLTGFEEKQVYKGRSFNNLYEVSSEWASHKPTHLIDKAEFEKYFELVSSIEAVPLR